MKTPPSSILLLLASLLGASAARPELAAVTAATPLRNKGLRDAMQHVHEQVVPITMVGYGLAFGAYSLRTYCVTCEATGVKVAIPALLVLSFLWRMSEGAVLRERANGSPNMMLETLNNGVAALNMVGSIAVFVDMLRCFLKQVAPAVA